MCTIWTIYDANDLCMFEYVCMLFYVFGCLMETCISAFSLPTCKKEVVHVSHTGKGRSTGEDPQLGTAISGDFCEFHRGLHERIVFFGRVG